MATTSSLAFSKMDPPAIDDTMEMASPYQGHADDFDIDLDVMDDQASNTDKDMMGADEFEEAPHGTVYEQDVANDADMIDDVAEPAMLDADQYAVTNYSLDMQYGTEKVYEAEMLEDDYDEDIDAPIPETRETPVSLESANNQVTSEEDPPERNDSIEANGENQAVEILSENSVDSTHPQDDAPEEVPPQHHHHQDDNNITRESEGEQPESENVGNNADDTNKPEQVEIHDIPDDHEGDSVRGEHPEAHEDDAGANKQTSDEHKESELQQKNTTEFDESHRQETEPAEDNELEQDTAKDTPLYPVRVYYQDNEISLFPPQEGDSSETFFLEDESLAYAPLVELFQSCRGVLQEHVGDNEVLVMDVDALNIQLTEDSIHISKVTLYQIVDLYLQLCHNDGIDEPEPLYLTLNTKLTISAEVSDLFLAASEGKGLSEIHSWDGYHEVEASSADIPERDEQELKPTEKQQDIPGQQNRHRSGSPEIHGNDVNIHEPQAAEAQLDEQYPEGDDAGADQPGNALEDNNNDDETKEASQLELESPELRDQRSPHDSYDSEAEQHTESTGTISNLPAIDLTDGQQHLDNSTEVLPNDQDTHDTHEEQYELVGTGDDDFPEEGASSVAANRVDYDNENEDNSSGYEHDFHGTEPSTEEHHEDVYSEAKRDAPLDQEDDTEETLRGDEENTPPKLDTTCASLPTNNAQSSADLADDPIGIAEDLLKSSVKGLANVVDDVEDTDFSGEINNVVEVTTANAIEEETEELPLDDEEYLDLGIADDLGDADEETGTKSPGPSSTKRHREPEDEFELAESPTPDAKRSRSS